MAKVAVRRSGDLYYNRVLATAPGNLVAYWPLSEVAGTAALDASGNELHGVYSNVTLGQTGIGDGRTCPAYDDASNSLCNVYSDGLRDAFPGNTGTLAAWLKAPETIWIANDEHKCAGFVTLNNSGVTISKPTATNTLSMNYYAGGVFNGGTLYYPVEQHNKWIHVAIAWDSMTDTCNTYINGGLQRSTSGIGTWAGQIGNGRAYIGGSAWTGNVAHVALWNVALDRDTVHALSYHAVYRPRVVIIGDSIVSYWTKMFAGLYKDGWGCVIDRSVGSQRIIAHMAAQVASIANDDADTVIVALGTNEVSSDVTAIKAVYGAQLQQLLSDHPSGRIYCQQVLRKMNGTSMYNSAAAQAIRACVTEAATERVWTTDCDGWVDGIADVTDPYTDGDLDGNVHPNPVGARKIADQYVTLLG